MNVVYKRKRKKMKRRVGEAKRRVTRGGKKVCKTLGKIRSCSERK